MRLIGEHDGSKILMVQGRGRACNLDRTEEAIPRFKHRNGCGTTRYRIVLRPRCMSSCRRHREWGIA